MHLTLTLAVVSTLAVAGCSRATLVNSQLSDPAARRKDLEASMQFFDEHPEDIADAYAAAKRHPKTFEAIMRMALKDPATLKTVMSAETAPHAASGKGDTKSDDEKKSDEKKKAP